MCLEAYLCHFSLPQIWQYVNGTLYSILSVPSVRQEAIEMVRQQKCPHLLCRKQTQFVLLRFAPASVRPVVSSAI